MDTNLAAWPRRRRAWFVAPLLLFPFFYAACESGATPATKPTTSSQAAPAALVRVAPVTQGALSLSRDYFATAQALDRAQLAAGASGEVRGVYARVGDKVQKGQVLVEVDRDLATVQVSQLSANRQQLTAQRAQLERDAKRIEALGKELAPQVEAERLRAQIEAIDAQLLQLDASLRGAKEQLSRHRVLAPFDGVVASRLVNPGDWVSPGTPALELFDDAGIEILVNAPPELLDQVKVDDEAAIKKGGKRLKAKIAGLVPSLAARTRTVTLRLLPQERADWLVPGQVVDASFTLSYQDPQGWIIPIDAVLEGGAGARALVVRDNKAVSIDLRVLEKSDKLALVLAPQAPFVPGDVAIIRGNERVRPGQEVKVQPEPTPSPSSLKREATP